MNLTNLRQSIAKIVAEDHALTQATKLRDQVRAQLYDAVRNAKNAADARQARFDRMSDAERRFFYARSAFEDVVSAATGRLFSDFSPSEALEIADDLHRTYMSLATSWRAVLDESELRSAINGENTV